RVYGDTYDTQQRYTSSTRSNCIYGDTSPCLYRWIGISQWAGTELQASFNWLQDSSLVTMVGADLRVVGVRAKQDVLNADTGAYRESSSNVIPLGKDKIEEVLGAYLQQTWSPTGWFALNAGARIDASERYDPVLSPRFAANLGAWRGGTIKL